ncbi:MAG: phytanoyl-CoA dioxygenase family protein, partial [Campylobacterota bacterium]|nr:phytanoyl-CoA dioxygenase family protein [Campylobacterota bacterium]
LERKFIEDGSYIFGEVLDADRADELYKEILKTRKFDSSLFMSEEEYLKNQNHLSTNPNAKTTLLNRFEKELEFFSKDEYIQGFITHFLGDDYVHVIPKVICGVPFKALPSWVAKKVENINVANLGAYIKPQYRDITYFRGIDLHQDIIDWEEGKTELDPSTFLTIYLYLHSVGKYDAPLHLMPKTHKFGISKFPHKLQRVDGNNWKYTDDNNRSMECKDIEIHGNAGFVGAWHSCTLHGTQPVKDESEEARISLRFLVGKAKENTNMTAIDRVNASIDGALKSKVMRDDLRADGKVAKDGNIINNAY